MYNILYVDDTKIKYNNKIYQINIAFNRFLKAIDILEDKELDEFERINYLYECFIDEKYKLNLHEKGELVNKIFKHVNELMKEKRSIESEKVMDIRQDFEYIYSSFWMDYRIDLLDQVDKLSWIKFCALLGGLSKNTKMAEVIKIRTMEVPKATKDNAKQRNNIIKQKAYYSLEQKEVDFQKQVDDLFGALKRVAKKKKKSQKK